MSLEEKLDYWVKQAQNDLNCFSDNGAQSKSIILALRDAGVLDWYELPEKKGVVAYTIAPDFRGGMCVNELFMYIKPEFRGKIRLFKELVEHLEEVAKKENCSSVRIASNIGYNDSVVLKCLQRFGYDTDVVVKYMR